MAEQSDLRRVDLADAALLLQIPFVSIMRQVLFRGRCCSEADAVQRPDPRNVYFLVANQTTLYRTIFKQIFSKQSPHWRQ